ncbi:MAG: DUF547 domain-containing protein [Bacteroidia bacterium]
MKRILIAAVISVIFIFQVSAQTNAALSMSEVLIYNARFNPADTRQSDILKTLNPKWLIDNLKTDNEKNSFWINVYNSFMLTFLRDTIYEGVYTNFYKLKNVTIAGKAFSLFDIEHEFLRLGKKNKELGFKKSKINKDTSWRKLRPGVFDLRVVFLMYRGLYGYPPFQAIENANLEDAYFNSTQYLSGILGGPHKVWGWVKPYLSDEVKRDKKWEYSTSPFAVHINNFYPKYEGPKFKMEEENPWLK